MFFATVMTLLVIAVIAYVNILAWPRRVEWHPDPLYPLMRRRVGRKWEYRPMTHDEFVDMVDRNAW